MQQDNKYLPVFGIVDKKILHQLVDEKKYTKKNAQWFFVDFSPADYDMNTRFDMILEGEEKKIVPKIFNIRILNVLDQTGKHLDGIPFGWKTICRFEFKPHIPAIIHKLPTLARWEFNNHLKFTRHEDLNPFKFDKKIYTDVISDFIALSINSNSIDKKNKAVFLDTISKIIHSDDQEMKSKLSDLNFIEEELKKQKLHIA